MVDIGTGTQYDTEYCNWNEKSILLKKLLYRFYRYCIDVFYRLEMSIELTTLMSLYKGSLLFISAKLAVLNLTTLGPWEAGSVV